MISIVLGLGFQWWVELREPWQYIAFIFAYIDIVDYWIDFSGMAKSLPPKKELGLMIDVGLMFSLFAYIYTAQTTIIYFLLSFILFRVLDFCSLLSLKREHHPKGSHLIFANTWLKINFFEIVFSFGIILYGQYSVVTSLVSLFVFIIFRIITRVVSVMRYKHVHFS
jgi:hypothetical protein